MKKVILLVIASLLLVGGIVYASISEDRSCMTDYKCMSDCLNQGYMYGYCKRLCSY